MRCADGSSCTASGISNLVNKSESLPRLVTTPAPDWLLQTAQQIQVIDYELHASIRTISRGEMTPDQVPAFMDACIRRDRLMARVINYVAEQRKQSAHHPVAARDGAA
jgi:dihydroorotase-like cyclic amidohydrolase